MYRNLQPISRNGGHLMKRALRTSAVATTVIAMTSVAQAGIFSWTGIDSNEWRDSGNWLSGDDTGFPDATGDTAIFGAPASGKTISIGFTSLEETDGNVSISNLTIQAAAVGGVSLQRNDDQFNVDGVITVENGAGASSLNYLRYALDVDFDIQGSSQFTVSGNISQAGTNKVLDKLGTGTLIFGGSSSTNQQWTISGGTLTWDNTAALRTRFATSGALVDLNVGTLNGDGLVGILANNATANFIDAADGTTLDLSMLDLVVIDDSITSPLTEYVLVTYGATTNLTLDPTNIFESLTLPGSGVLDGYFLVHDSANRQILLTIPEPATMALLALGGLLVGGRQRRDR